MTLSNFAIQSVKYNGVYYTGIQGHAADYGIEMVSPASDGVVHETFHAIGKLSPRANFSTLAIATMFTALAAETDSPMKALDGSAGIILVGAKAGTSTPTYAASTVHEALTGLNGLLYMTSLSMPSSAKPAVMSLGVAFTSTDGTAAALSPSAVALPTQPIPVEAYILTAITHNSTALDGWSDCVWNAGVGVRQLHSGGDIYPRLIDVSGAGGPIRHRITFNTTDLSFLRTIGILGSTSTLTLTLTQLAQGGTRGSGTVTLTINGRLGIARNPASGSQGSPMSASVEFIPRYDGTNKPVTITVA